MAKCVFRRHCVERVAQEVACEEGLPRMGQALSLKRVARVPLDAVKGQADAEGSGGYRVNDNVECGL